MPCHSPQIVAARLLVADMFAETLPAVGPELPPFGKASRASSKEGPGASLWSRLEPLEGEETADPADAVKRAWDDAWVGGAGLGAGEPGPCVRSPGLGVEVPRWASSAAPPASAEMSPSQFAARFVGGTPRLPEAALRGSPGSKGSLAMSPMASHRSWAASPLAGPFSPMTSRRSPLHCSSPVCESIRREEHALDVVAEFEAAIDRLIPECRMNLEAAFEPALGLPEVAPGDVLPSDPLLDSVDSVDLGGTCVALAGGSPDRVRDPSETSQEQTASTASMSSMSSVSLPPTGPLQPPSACATLSEASSRQATLSEASARGLSESCATLSEASSRQATVCSATVSPVCSAGRPVRSGQSPPRAHSPRTLARSAGLTGSARSSALGSGSTTASSGCSTTASTRSSASNLTERGARRHGSGPFCLAERSASPQQRRGAARPGDSEDDAAALEEAFQALCGPQRSLGGRGFAKLCKDCGLLDQRLTASDADIIFAKVAPRGSRSVDAAQFQHALELVAERKGLELRAVRRVVVGSARQAVAARPEPPRLPGDAARGGGCASPSRQLSFEPWARPDASPRVAHRQVSHEPWVPVGAHVPARPDASPRAVHRKVDGEASPRGIAARAVPTPVRAARRSQLPERSEDCAPAADLTAAEGDALERTFRAFCGGRQELDGRSFTKLCRDCRLVDRQLTASDADIIFAKVVPRGGQRRLGLPHFEAALRLVAERKGVDEAAVRRAVAESRGPMMHATKTDAVRFHDDRSTYTGTHLHGGPEAGGRGAWSLTGQLAVSPSAHSLGSQ